MSEIRKDGASVINEELQAMFSSVPCGLCVYRIEGEKISPMYHNPAFYEIMGYSEEHIRSVEQHTDFLGVHPEDRASLWEKVQESLRTGTALRHTCRVYHDRKQEYRWICLEGSVKKHTDGTRRFYGVYTDVSGQKILENELTDAYGKMQDIVNTIPGGIASYLVTGGKFIPAFISDGGIYVIDKDNFDLLYANESKRLFHKPGDCVARKCYEALHGQKEPCKFCTLKSHAADGKAHEMAVEGTQKCFSTSFRMTNWNGIPAYVKYVQDVTQEVRTRREKERLEQYFETMIKYLAGGVAVMHCNKNGVIVPESLSDGFAAMTGMSLEDTWNLYREDAMAGVHPDDKERIGKLLEEFSAGDDLHCEGTYRLRNGNSGYVWVKNTLTMIEGKDGERKFYASYHDMTKEREEQEDLRLQYKDMIMRHYTMPGPNTLILGHCNITQNRIIEIIDHTDSDLLKTFSTDREAFFTGVSTLVVDEDESQAFRDCYLNEPSLAAFNEGRTEVDLNCFIKIPKEETGRYVQFMVNLVETPDTGDITGILTVTDITEQTVADRILHRMSQASYDRMVDVNLREDHCVVLNCSQDDRDVPGTVGRYSDRLTCLIEGQVLPKDRELLRQMLDPEYMQNRLEQEDSYSFSYSITGSKGSILTKKLTVSAIDLRLGRVCLARTDITDSVREQQGFLNVVAYTFELLAFIKVDIRQLIMHTRHTVLENLPPFIIEDYENSFGRLASSYGADEQNQAESMEPFRLSLMLKRLEESPTGYDFVMPYHGEQGLRYKQINVLWGDRDHNTVCMVRVDVTDMLAAERQTKAALESALSEAETANQAKSDFLSSMSHDIRTPMNAIIGMTTLAFAHLDDRERLKDYLEKISYSSKHLLSLINDILDMSKIERTKITLGREKIVLSDLTGQLLSMLTPQAEAAELDFKIQTENITHPCFYGDTLRINQILINILGNAIKFTPPGGQVVFKTEELPDVEPGGRVRYRFTVRDTGIGMTEEFLTHIFEPFTRNRNTAQVEGTGLGLSITKGLVDLMGGTITVESKPHEGTAFQVELVCEAAPEKEKAKKRAHSELGGFPDGKELLGRRFLVAEDNAINSQILCELLKMYGAGFAVREDGIQAVQEFKDSAPGDYDAILMDIRMPAMNGYDATRVIRKLNRPDAVTIPIIAMTANAFSEDIEEAMAVGMNAHVAKPIDMQMLLSTLNRILDGEGR